MLQFVVQMGKSKMNTDPPDDIGRFKDTGLMVMKHTLISVISSNNSNFFVD